jgi:hypothetical protein
MLISCEDVRAQSTWLCSALFKWHMCAAQLASHHITVMVYVQMDNNQESELSVYSWLMVISHLHIFITMGCTK